ncbi:MAG: hypothetical protein A4E56_00420 [Pelotomaculum sp. PtaU1.Bin065]|nr:MAG: hypothetical protein A4E56_00420 [Pelotomaculum sp. PtaU1.Bin065]
MKFKLSILQIFLYVLVVLTPAYADGVPIDYMVSIPTISSGQPGGYYGDTWKTIWSYSPPEGRKAVGVTLKYKCETYSYGFRTRIVANGVEKVRDVISGGYGTGEISCSGSYDLVEVQWQALRENEAGPMTILTGSTVTVEGYVASDVDVIAAKIAAETAATNATSANSAANNAALYAINAANNTTYNGQSVAYMTSMISYNMYPTIEKVQGKNGSTCTTGSSYTVVIASNPSSGVSYRVTCNSYDSGWVSNNNIVISSGIVSGANTATIRVRNNMGNESSTTLTFFKI